MIAIRTDRGLREALVAEDAHTFFVTPHWQTSPSVLIWLDTVSTDELREVVVEAWRARAPKHLVRTWDASRSHAT